MTTPELTGWATVAQHRHFILSWCYASDGDWHYARSACGQLLAPSSYDRAPDAPACVPCSALHPTEALTRAVS